MARQKQTDGYEGRLTLALHQGPRPMSVRHLADEMGGNDERGIPGDYVGLRGTSYGGIRQYAEGKVVNPRVELLRAMADVLEVRGDWLAFDDGAMTEVEERARAQGASVADSRSDDKDLKADSADLKAAFLAGLPALSTTGAASWHAIGDLYSQYFMARLLSITAPISREALERVASGKDHDPVAYKKQTQGAQIAAARKVAELVGAAAKAADVDLSQLSRWALDRYIQITVQALSVLFGPAGIGRRGLTADEVAQLEAGHLVATEGSDE